MARAAEHSFKQFSEAGERVVMCEEGVWRRPSLFVVSQAVGFCGVEANRVQTANGPTGESGGGPLEVRMLGGKGLDEVVEMGEVVVVVDLEV